MLLPISWQQYLLSIGAVITVYYLTILIINRNQVLNIIHGRRSKFDTVSTIDGSDNKRPESQPNVANSRLNTKEQDLINEIHAYTTAAADNENKENMLSALAIILGKYPFVKVSYPKESINKIISESCAKNCSVHLSDSDVNGLWEVAEQS